MAALTNVRDTSELGGKYIALPVKGLIQKKRSS